MKCREAQSKFSLYLDGALEGSTMQAVGLHVARCSECAPRYVALERTRQLVVSLGRKPAPPELALRIRVAVSQQRGVTWQRRMQGLLVRAENAINAVMLPATGGVVAAVLVLGLIIGFFGPPRTSASDQDIPTSLYTPPRLVSNPLSTLPTSAETPVVIEAYVDANGRVGDYRIIAGKDDAEVRREVERALIFTTFEPATAFGERSSGTAVISFANVNVKG